MNEDKLHDLKVAFAELTGFEKIRATKLSGFAFPPEDNPDTCIYPVSLAVMMKKHITEVEVWWSRSAEEGGDCEYYDTLNEFIYAYEWEWDEFQSGYAKAAADHEKWS